MPSIIQEETMHTPLDTGTVVKVIANRYGSEGYTGNTGVVMYVSGVFNEIVNLDMGAMGKDLGFHINDIEIVNNGTRDYKDNIARTIAGQLALYQTKRKQVAKNEVNRIRDAMYVKQDEIQQLIAQRKAVDTFYKSESRKASNGMRIEATYYTAVSYLLSNYYDTISVNGAYIIATTKNVSTVYEKKHIDFGKYLVQITLPKVITIRAFTKDDTIKDNYDHPHINNGKPCFGTWGNQIYEAMESWDIPLTLNLVYRYLSSTSKGDWYLHPLYWADDIDDRCTSCMQLECRCDDEEICEHCDHTMNDCSCMHCPSSGEVMPDGIDEYCEDCRHWRWIGDDDDHSEGGECDY